MLSRILLAAPSYIATVRCVRTMCCVRLLALPFARLSRITAQESVLRDQGGLSP
jgi:hypothetical protein